MLLLVCIGLIINLIETNILMNSAKNDYQGEVNGLVSPDFVLVSSQIENEGIDVGTVLIDDYTTRLSYGQAFSVIAANAKKKGYYSTPVLAECFGGFDINSDRGSIEVCQTKYVNGERTFEIRLTNFTKNPEKMPPAQCVGDCKP